MPLLGKHGRFHQLIKNSKRRREFKEDNAKRDEEIKAMEDRVAFQDSKIQNLVEKIQRFEKGQEEADRNADRLNELFQKNVIDQHGNLIKEREVL